MQDCPRKEKRDDEVEMTILLNENYLIVSAGAHPFRLDERAQPAATTAPQSN